MILLTKTPMRITLFGGGSDYPSYFKKRRGFCISAGISKYSFCTFRSLATIDEYKYRVCYKQTELVNDLRDIRQPVVKAALSSEGFDKDRLEIHYFSDLPSSSGLGSSSAFACGLLGGLRLFRGKSFTNAQLASSAWELEANIMGETVGVQDQYSCALGGVITLEMSDRGVFATQFPHDEFFEYLQNSLVLIYTGKTRFSQDVIKSQSDALNGVAETDYVSKVVSLADDASKLISKRTGVEEIGAMLSEAWELKRNFGSDVSSAFLDDMYASIMKQGAYGAKLIGAGGGGFFLVSASKMVQSKLAEKFGESRVVNIKFSHTGFEHTVL
jgi:D-glycero-alpha-D-manno-heptose-7-phosphate kinase